MSSIFFLSNFLQLYPDKGKGREILGFAVRCSNNNLGCPWVNELRELEVFVLKFLIDFIYVYHHSGLTSIAFKIISFPSFNFRIIIKFIQCVVSACAERFQRQFEDEHYKRCNYRMVQCQFCKEDYIFAFEKVLSC